MRGKLSDFRNTNFLIGLLWQSDWKQGSWHLRYTMFLFNNASPPAFILPLGEGPPDPSGLQGWTQDDASFRADLRIYLPCSAGVDLAEKPHPRDKIGNKKITCIMQCTSSKIQFCFIEIIKRFGVISAKRSNASQADLILHDILARCSPGRKHGRV